VFLETMNTFVINQMTSFSIWDGLNVKRKKRREEMVRHIYLNRKKMDGSHKFKEHIVRPDGHRA